MLEIVLWIIGITAITLAGSYYARKYNAPDALIALYCTFVVLSQIMAAKVASYDLIFVTVFAPTAVLVYAVTYLFTDVVNEKFGRAAVHRMILIALACQIAMVFFLYISTVLSPAPFWSGQDFWAGIFGIVPRITIASLISFYVSENIDAIIFDVFKKYTHGRHLWARNVISSIPALTIDTLIFIPLAFYGTMPIMSLMVGQMLTKWLVGIISIPFMYLNRWTLFKGEKNVDKSGVSA